VIANIHWKGLLVRLGQVRLGQVNKKCLHLVGISNVYNMDVDILTVGDLDVGKRSLHQNKSQSLSCASVQKAFLWPNARAAYVHATVLSSVKGNPPRSIIL
jgi:hypothetical protein